MASDSWPPPAIAPFVGDWLKWAAWWASDTDKLDANAPQPTNVPQQSRRNGGRFWSRQQSAPLSPARNLLHVPLAADIAQTSADLLFGDQPRFTIPKDEGRSSALQARLDGLFHEAAILNDLHFGAEVCAAIGGVFLRPMWDTNLADRPLLTVVGADQAIPELRNGILVAVTFWEQLPSDDTAVVWRHLERHEKGRIRHTLHMGTADHLGTVMPYEAHPDMQWLVDMGNLLIDGDSISTEKITKGLLVSYVPNAPSRRHRRAGIGRADIDGSEGLLDALDETWCADEATEILTDHGWVGYRDLHEGDTVLTLNHVTGLSEWQAVQEVCVFPAQPREMVSIESRSHSSLTTPNHRWPVERPHYRGGEHKAVSGFDRTWATSETFLLDDRVPLIAECASLPGEAKYTDALVEAVAWFWTEGHIRKLRDGRPGRNVVITQSPTANPHLCERIRATLTRLFGPAVDAFPRFGKALSDGTPRWREGANGKRWEFVLNGDAGEIVQEFAPGRVPTHEFLLSLTKAQLDLFIETSMLADNSGEHSLAQKDRAAAEAFQFACILAGRATSVGKIDYRPRGHREYDMTNVRMRSQRHFWPGRPGVRETVTYDGEVWCPRTANQTWLARRNGKVYFTGNTSWMRDLRLGRARVVVEEQALVGTNSFGNPGRPTLPVRGFDLDQEVFAPIPGGTGFGADGPVKPVQFAIRVEEHHATAQALVEQIVTDCGYAPQTFGIHAEGALSGTAHRLRELRTHRTEGRKQRLWGPAAEHATHMLLAIGREVFGWEQEVRPSIEWAETDADEPLQRAQTIEVLARARALSIETAVRMAQPQLDDIAVGKEVERIKGDDGIVDGETVPVAANLP